MLCALQRHVILPCAVCFATSRRVNHAICNFIDSSGLASEPIRICLFIDCIINLFRGCRVELQNYIAILLLFFCLYDVLHPIHTVVMSGSIPVLNQY